MKVKVYRRCTTVKVLEEKKILKVKVDISLKLLQGVEFVREKATPTEKRLSNNQPGCPGGG